MRHLRYLRPRRYSGAGRRMVVCLVLMSVVLLAQACGPTIYTSSDFNLARQTHRTVAILPYEVTIASQHLPKDITRETIEKLEIDEGKLFQQQLYMEFLQRYRRGQYSIAFQDIERTNALLEQAGLQPGKLTGHTKEALAELLGVDAVISGTIRRSRPMSTGLAVGLGLLVGFWGSTNRVDVGLNVHDGTSGQLLWKYDHQVSGSVGSSPERMARSLMKSVSRTFPYRARDRRPARG